MTWTATEIHRCCLFSPIVVRAIFHCVAIFIILQALLQPMSLDTDLELVTIDIVLTGHDSNVMPSNGSTAMLVDSRRQDSGDFRKVINTRRPTFFTVCETHLDGDPIKALIP